MYRKREQLPPIDDDLTLRNRIAHSMRGDLFCFIACPDDETALAVRRIKKTPVGIGEMIVRRYDESSHVDTPDSPDLGTDLVFVTHQQIPLPARFIMLPNLDMQALISRLPESLLDAPAPGTLF